MTTTTTADLAQGFVEQQGNRAHGFWSAQESLRDQIAHWLSSLEAEAVDRAIDDPMQGHHGLVESIRNADVSELEIRVKALLDPESLAEVNPADLPNETYGDHYRQHVMNAHPGGLGVGLFDDIRGAAVTQRRYAGNGGLYGRR